MGTPTMASSSLHQDLATFFDPVSSASAQPGMQVSELPMEPVIQSIIHLDPPANRDAGLVALQADLQWADDVENRIQNEAASDGEAQAVQVSNNVYLLSFRSGQG